MMWFRVVFLVVSCYLGYILFAVHDEDIDVPARVPMFRAMSISGKSVTEEDILPDGVIYFFRSSCAYCLLELPVWQEIREKYPAIKIMAVLHKESISDAREFFLLHDNPFDYVVEDTNSQLWHGLGARSTPEAFILKEGQVIGHLGYMRYGPHTLYRKLDKLGGADFASIISS